MAEYAHRLPRTREAFAKLSTKSAILGGKLVLIDPRGAAHFLSTDAGDAQESS